MPKVTQDYRDRQAARIRAAAERCFARNGFHATSMDEVIAAAGVSSSTVYRYYPDGKQSLIRAVSAARIDPLLQRIASLADSERLPPIDRVFVDILGGLGITDAGASNSEEYAALDRSARLAVNGWTELSRDPQVHDLIRGNYLAIRAQLTKLIRRWVDEGAVTTRLGPEEISSLMQNAAFGVIAEQVITGHADISAAARRLKRLLTP